MFVIVPSVALFFSGVDIVTNSRFVNFKFYRSREPASCQMWALMSIMRMLII